MRGGHAVPRWRSYVALGDSLSEGLADPDPAVPGAFRGWADVFAGIVSQRRTAAGESPLEYANLAIRGRKLGAILDEQVPVALEAGADLVSLMGGGNDILRPSIDVDHLADRLEAAVVALRADGSDVLLSTGYDPAQSRVLRPTRGRTGVFNAHVWSIAQRHGAHVLDFWGMRSLMHPSMWVEDRIHLSTAGHARVAQAALVAVGLEPDRRDWDDPLAPAPPVPRLVAGRAHLAWARRHLAPWVVRRLRGRSSGDTVLPKRPTLLPVSTAEAATTEMRAP